MSESVSLLAPQFDNWSQQRQAATLGMWVFLATEVLFFGGLFLAYFLYRDAYPLAFAAGSGHLKLLFGGLNTAVLLTSSLTMTLADRASIAGRCRALTSYLGITALLGAVFLGIKALEWAVEFRAGRAPLPGWAVRFDRPDAGQEPLFFHFYFGMTGLHALHLLIGIVLVLLLIAGVALRRNSLEAKIVMVGLYWHFIDVVWLFLFASLYLAVPHA